MIKLKDILTEQLGMPTGGASMYPSYQAVEPYREPVEKAVKATMDWIYDHRHTLLDIAALGATFIFAPAGIAIELVNAGLYFKEGDVLMGSISTIFAALPLIGSIPGVKQAVGFALKRGVKYSLSQIKKILEAVVKFKNKIKALFTQIKRVPQAQEYAEMLLTGKIDYEEFVGLLTSLPKAGQVLGKTILKKKPDMWFHKTDKLIALQNWIKQKKIIGKSIDQQGGLKNFDTSVQTRGKTSSFVTARQNQGTPMFQKGSLYGSKPSKYLMTTELPDAAFIPNLQYVNLPSFTASRGAGVLKPTEAIRNIKNYKFWIWDETIQNYIEISPQLLLKK
jgi:hypothetical protein